MERQTKHQNTTYSTAHSISKQGSRYGPLVCPSKPSSGGLQRICSWHPDMRHSREKESSQRNHHIERGRRRRLEQPRTESDGERSLTAYAPLGAMGIRKFRTTSFTLSTPWSRFQYALPTDCIFFFFFSFPSYISGVHHFWVRFLRMWPFFNPTIKVVTFRLRGWCVLGVFLLPAFTRLGHERQDLLSPCEKMHVCTD